AHSMAPRGPIIRAACRVRAQTLLLKALAGMSLYWLCYRHSNQICVVIEPARFAERVVFCSSVGILKRERKNEIGSCRSHAADCRGNSRRCTAIPVVSRICRCKKPTSATSSGFGEYGNRRHLHMHRNPCP